MLKLKEGWHSRYGNCAYRENAGGWVFAHLHQSPALVDVYIPTNGGFSDQSGCKLIEVPLSKGETWQEAAHRAYVAAGVESPWEVCEESDSAPAVEEAVEPPAAYFNEWQSAEAELSAAQSEVNTLLESNARLAIKNHRASVMIAQLKRANDARPESPAYYLQNGVDCADIVNAYNLSYWDGGAVCHILRAGNKPGESRLQALENALACLRHSIAVERGAK